MYMPLATKLFFFDGTIRLADCMAERSDLWNECTYKVMNPYVKRVFSWTSQIGLLRLAYAPK